MFKKYLKIFMILSAVYFLNFNPVYSEKSKLRILTENYPPYNYVENGEIKGSNAEIVKEIIKRLNLDVKIECMPWDEAYKICLTEKNVVLFSTIKIDERKDLFKWAGPLSKHKWSFFAKKGSGIKLEKLEDAKKYSIGAYKDDACEIFLKSQKFEKLYSIINDEENAVKLVNGDIDLWIGIKEAARGFSQKAGIDFDTFENIFDIKTVELYIAFNKETDDKIVAEFQKELDEIKKQQE